MLTRFSLVLIAALGLLPYVSTIKLPPIPSFWAEWTAVVLAGAWLASLRRVRMATSDAGHAVNKAKPSALSVPAAVLAFAALGVILLMQLLAGMPIFKGEPWLTLGALLLASLTCLAGARLRAAGEVPRVLDAWAAGVLLALLLNLVATLLERHGLHLYELHWAWRAPPGRSEGLLGQANHLAVFAVIAAAAAHYLWLRGKLGPAGHVLVSLCSAVLVASSASRTGALLWVLMAAFAALALRGQPSRTTGWRLLAIGAVLFLALEATWTMLDPGRSASVVVLHETRPRYELFRDSWELILRHPWAGVGYGNFMAARWTELSDSLSEPTATHAHNLVTELLVELGVLPALIVLLPLGFGLWRCVRIITRRDVAPEQFLAAGIALLLAAYSLAEYPLWYTFFLLPFALALGLIDQRDIEIPVSTAANWQRFAGWSLAGAACVVVALDYHRSERLYTAINLQQQEGNGTTVGVPLKEASDIAALSAFDLYANQMYARALVPDGLFMEYKLEITRRAMLGLANEETIARQVATLVVSNEREEADVLVARTRRDPTLERRTRETLVRMAPVNPKIQAYLKTLPALPPAEKK